MQRNYQNSTFHLECQLRRVDKDIYADIDKEVEEYDKEDYEQDEEYEQDDEEKDEESE